MNRKMLAPIIIGILIAFYMMIWISGEEDDLSKY